MVMNLNCIDELCIDPRFRRKKIGRRLVETAIADCKSRSFQSLQVGLEDFNESAITFFQSIGWQQVGAEPISISAQQQLQALVFSHSVATA